MSWLKDYLATLTPEELDAHKRAVRELVDKAPPLTPEQYSNLRTLLRRPPLKTSQAEPQKSA